jgi:hypothetical protein
VTKDSFDQHSKSSGSDKEQEKKATQSQEERAQAEENGEVANAKEEERQQAEVTRRVVTSVGTSHCAMPKRETGDHYDIQIPR